MTNALFTRATLVSQNRFNQRATGGSYQRHFNAALESITDRIEAAPEIVREYVEAIAAFQENVSDVGVFQIDGLDRKPWTDGVTIMADALKATKKTDELAEKLQAAAMEKIGPKCETMPEAEIYAHLLAGSMVVQLEAIRTGRRDRNVTNAETLANNVERFIFLRELDRQAYDAFMPLLERHFGIDFTLHVVLDRAAPLHGNRAPIKGFYRLKEARFDWDTAINANAVQIEEYQHGNMAREELSQWAEIELQKMDRENDLNARTRGVGAPAGDMGASEMDAHRRDDSDALHRVTGGFDNGFAD